MAETTWATPKAFFDQLNSRMNFTLDVAALPGTAKCENFFTPEIDGLSQDWTNDIFFMNLPYGRGQNVYSWVEKAYQTAQEGGTGACLLPLSGDTKWYHDFVLNSDEIIFVRDRIWFELNGIAARANHASMVVIFTPKCKGYPKISSMSNCRNR